MTAFESAGAAPAAQFDRFARFYDADYREYDQDIEAIGALAEEYGDPVIEWGAGTGRVLLPLAAAGHTVTGVDVSPELLAQARRKLEGAEFANRVTFVEGDMRTVTLARSDYAFAYCTSNTLMHITTAEGQQEMLANVRRHLRPGGFFFLDLFNPDIPRLLDVNGLQELADQWQDPATGATVLKWSIRRIDLAEQLQETLFIYEENFPDGQVRRTLCPFTLRYWWRNEGELMLAAAGFAVEEVWGDFDANPYEGMSERLIFVARAR